MDTQVDFDPQRMTAQGIDAWARAKLNPPAAPETPTEAGERRAATRADAGLEVARARAAMDRELPSLAAAEKKARNHLATLAPGYIAAMRAVDEAALAHARRASDLEYTITLAERRIEANSESVIDDFAFGLIELRQHCLSTPVVEEERNPIWDSEAAQEVFEVWSNQAAIIARSEAILAAFRAAKAMKADPDQSNIRERLTALIDGLPGTDVMTKVYTPAMREPSRRWPTYEEYRGAEIGMDPEDLREIRRGGQRRSRFARLLGR